MTTPLPTSLTGLLKRTGLLSDAQVASLLQHAQQNETTLINAVVSQGFAAEDAFLEWAEVHENCYGSPRAPAMAALNAMPTESIFDALMKGKMKEQAAGMTSR